MEKVLVKRLLQGRSSTIIPEGAIVKEKARLVVLRPGIDNVKRLTGRWIALKSTTSSTAVPAEKVPP